MIRLTDIEKLRGIRKIIPGSEDAFRMVVADSSAAAPGSLFVAVRGTRVDGHQYISDALAKGATGIVCEALPEQAAGNATVIQVRDSAEFLGLLASLWYGNPTRHLKITGITGTNGKTTVATSLYHLFNHSGKPAGLVATTGIYFGDHVYPTIHTTPDALTLQKYFSLMLKEGVRYVFMEVSSHAAAQKRIAGIDFAGGVFTNLSQDHLDYHKDLKSYLFAKKSFFDILPVGAFALINTDDRHSSVMVQNTQATVHTFALQRIADFRPEVIEQHFDGTLIRYGQHEVWLPFPGDFSVYNMTAVFAVATLLGLDEETAWQGISRLPQVPGRFEVIRSPEGKYAVVDYAHTPDAIAKVLKTIRKVRSEKAKIITVVGAGGNRDRSKRPRMARIAFDLSDHLILTSDNPRNEDPEMIIHEMLEGLDPGEKNRVPAIPDRAEAIRTAWLMAQPGDIVLVAGKGHETYQEIQGVRHHFDDREAVRNLFENVKH